MPSSVEYARARPVSEFIPSQKIRRNPAMQRAGRSLLLLALLACAAPPALAGDGAITNRPAAWAAPIQLEGVPNLHQVSATLYRSAQPTAAGMRAIEKLGVKTVINLRSFHSDQDELKGSNLEGASIPMKTWHPELEEAAQFLRIISDPTRGPFLVHCQHGADRTGTMCALYRIAVEGWSKEDAIREMKEGGYGFHEVWKNLPVWIERLDIEALRKAAQSG